MLYKYLGNKRNALKRYLNHWERVTPTQNCILPMRSHWLYSRCSWKITWLFGRFKVVASWDLFSESVEVTTIKGHSTIDKSVKQHPQTPTINLQRLQIQFTKCVNDTWIVGAPDWAGTFNYRCHVGELKMWGNQQSLNIAQQAKLESRDGYNQLFPKLRCAETDSTD